MSLIFDTHGTQEKGLKIDRSLVVVIIIFVDSQSGWQRAVAKQHTHSPQRCSRAERHTRPGLDPAGSNNVPISPSQPRAPVQYIYFFSTSTSSAPLARHPADTKHPSSLHESRIRIKFLPPAMRSDILGCVCRACVHFDTLLQLKMITVWCTLYKLSKIC